MANLTPEEVFRGIIDGSIEEISEDALDNLASIAAHRLRGCTSLKEFLAHNMVTVNQYAFYGCAALEAVDISKVTRAYNYAFSNCTSLKEAVMEKDAISGGSCMNVFAGCTNLERAYTPEIRLEYASNTFNNCTKLKKLCLPKATRLHGHNWSGCSALEVVDIKAPTNGTGDHFSNCSSFNKLIIRKTGGVFALGGTSYFNSTPFAAGGSGGTLYVPSALIASYEAATNWSTVLGRANNSIEAIEGSEYEYYYADGTPIES